MAAWILAEFSFCVFIDRDEVEVHKNIKRERGQYPAILTELAWSIKDLLYDIKSTEKMIFLLVYFRALKKKPGRWRLPLYLDWINTENTII